MKLKCLKLSDYFEIKKPSYIYLKLIPDSSIRNYDSSAIAKTVASMYRGLSRKIKRENKKLIVETNIDVSFITHIKKDDVSFYMRVPKFYRERVLDKIQSVWKKITVEEVSELPTINGVKYNLYTNKEDALSLSIDKKNNDPLNQVFNILDIMESEEEILITCNFSPCTQVFWASTYKRTIEKAMQNQCLNKYMSASRIGYGIILSILSSITGAVEAIFGSIGKKDENLSFLESVAGIIRNNEFSQATDKKKNATVLSTTITVESSSKNIERAKNNAITVCESYRAVEDDNVLGYRELKGKRKIRKNLLSIDECSNFIQVAGRELQEKYGFIHHIDTNESLVPEELRQGVICLGTNTYKGNKTKAFVSTDKEFQYLTLCIIAGTRGGKTTLMGNISNNCINGGECVINLDFCGKCQMANDLCKVIPEEKVLNIECSDGNNIEGLAFNEIFYNGNDAFKKYRSAKEQASLLVEFINNINITNPLEPRMLRYLKASAVMCYYLGKSTGCALNCLEDHELRNMLLAKIQDVTELKNSVRTLLELNDYDKNGDLVGTKISYVSGILNRADIIRGNAYMELMLDKQNSNNNINLINEMQKNQLINFRIPEIMFKTDDERDIYTLYWLIKIWGALQERMEMYEDKDLIKVNLFVDELYQVPLAQTFLKNKLNQIAKKRCKPIISCHSLEQVKYIRPELKSANTSYMLISGCQKDNFKELKEELYPYELEDLLKLPRYHSLNLMKIRDGYSVFITKLPKPLVEHEEER